MSRRFWLGFLAGIVWAALVVGALWVASRHTNATGCQPGHEMSVTGGILQDDGSVLPVYACVADMRLEA